MGRTKTKSKEMTLDCARDPGRTRTLISSSYWGGVQFCCRGTPVSRLILGMLRPTVREVF